MKLNYLGHMNTIQVKEMAKKTSLAMLPIGPVEVHGPHLPLMTDVVSAVEMVERAAVKLREKGIEAVIAPPVNYCLADHASVLDGTITLRPETVSGIIEDICLGLAKWNFTHIVIVNGHGEPRNREAIQEGARRAEAKNSKLHTVIPDWLWGGMSSCLHVMKCARPEDDIHAGEWETALIMMKYPELVDEQAMRQLTPNWAENFGEKLAAGLDNFIDLGAPQGYFGDPNAATVETGEKVYDHFAEFVMKDTLDLLKK